MTSERAGVWNRTMRGMGWAYGSYVVGRLLVLVSIAALARLLTPSEFGLVAIALILITLLDTIAKFGVSEALIVESEDRFGDKADTAWTMGMIAASVLALATAALGPVAAEFFDQPELTVMLPVLGVNFILRALGLTHFALAQKQIDFRTRTVAEMADIVVRGGVGIGLAFAGAGAYSLVGGYLAGTLAMTITLWALVPFRPSPRLHRDLAGSLLRFGGGLTVLDVISAIVTNADYIVIGRVLGTTDLGFYTIGWRFPELLIINFAAVAGLVLFPTFAEIDRRRLADAYLDTMRYTLMLCVPLAAGLFLLAEPTVLFFFGDRWIESIDAMRILSLYAFFIAVSVPGGVACKAIGRVDVLVWLSIPCGALAIGAMVLLADRGILAIAACQASVAALLCTIQVALAARLLGTGVRSVLAAAGPALAGGLALSGVVAASTSLLDDPFITLAVAALLGATTYAVVLWLVAPEALRRLWRLMKQRRAAPAVAESGAPPPDPDDRPHPGPAPP